MTGKLRCELVTWERVARLARVLAREIRTAGFEPDLIVAIARGGYVPARLLADCLGVMNLTSFRIEHYLAGADRQPQARVKYPLAVDVTGLRVLVVDDVGDTGDTFAVAMEHLREHGAPAEIRTAVMHYKAGCRFLPDFCAQKVASWRWLTYPWAAVEDLSAFIERLPGGSDTLEGIAAQLKQEHGLRVPRTLLADVLELMKR
jgi:hypothetical protein